MSVVRTLRQLPAFRLLHCRTWLQHNRLDPYVHWPSRQSSQSLTQLSAAPLVEYPAGKRIGGFTVLRNETVPELALTAVHLLHVSTGAQHLHLARADRHNAFAVVFRTPPRDNTGVAHILEHMVLCGSRRFPVRHPLVHMQNRSLATFMDTSTKSDHTMYAFSTPNRKDFVNLLDVFLDATFFPTLRKVDFRQEGIRVEPWDLYDPSSCLTSFAFSGVGFMEMKGVYRDAESLYARRIPNYLLPSGTYGFDSHGDPMEMPHLTWEQLRSFHAAYYHPTNARFFSYGNIPLESHLDFVETAVLRHYDKQPIDSQVPPEPRWAQPREVTFPGPVNSLAPVNKNVTVSVSYLWPDVRDPLETSCIALLGKLLLSGPQAPFQATLLQSKLGADYSPGTGNHLDAVREGFFSVGLKNVAEEDTQKIICTIRSTIDSVVKTGFKAEHVQAILHEVELCLPPVEKTFGQNLLRSLIPLCNHDADPIDHLQITLLFDRFRQAMAGDPEYLQKKVKAYLQDNAHNVTLIMKADAAYGEHMREKEGRLLGEKLSVSNPPRSLVRRVGVLSQAKELEDDQKKVQDVSVLPTLKLSDIEPTLPRASIREINVENTPIFCVSAPTSGMTYFRALISTEGLPAELRPYVPLFCWIVTSMGAGELDYRQLSQRIELTTGGLSAAFHAAQRFPSTGKYEQGIILSSHCLDRNIPAMFALWKDIFTRLCLQDLHHFAVLLRQMRDETIASLTGDRGYWYAVSYQASQLQSVACLREEWTGLQQIRFLRHLVESGDLRPTLEKLRLIAKHVLTKDRMCCSLNTTPEIMKTAMGELGEFLSVVDGNGRHQPLVPEATFEPRGGQCTYVTFPFEMHCASKSCPVVPFDHADYPALRVLAHLLTAKLRCNEIHENCDRAWLAHDGLFHFYSYRNPNCVQRFEAFKRSVEWASNGEFSDQDVEDSKLRIFGEVDDLWPPSDEGRNQFLYSMSDEMYQCHREELLAVTRKQLVLATSKYLGDDQQAVSTLFGPADAVVEKQGWRVVSSGVG
ncbi:presequence protease, mitochondrial-like [Paramacrobiotus metropolitanus]|uniref:presequence protease, mitochondrial-like n=1 Tax=Paramacrobiotus metropolitanus TaxID=2943436 RepID=UPI0024460B33|nr:presequence protease, mitochondrial-like [Paramacrobiotus metropolitanus]